MSFYSQAGPIGNIFFSQGGKSVFIIYEFEEAVTTAKEIFKDVKLYGRPVRMYSQSDIDDICSRRSEQIDLKRKRETEIGPSPKRRYDEFPRQYNYPGYNQSPNSSWSHSNYQTNRSFTSDRVPEGRERKPEGFSPRTENPYLTASRNSYRNRSDLMPDSKKTYLESPDVPPGVTRDEYERERTTPNFDSSRRNDHKPYDGHRTTCNDDSGVSVEMENPYKPTSRKEHQGSPRNNDRTDFVMENPYNTPVSRNEWRDGHPPDNSRISFEMENPYYQRARNERRDFSHRNESPHEHGYQRNRDKHYDRDSRTTSRDYDRDYKHRGNQSTSERSPRHQYQRQKPQNQSYKSRRH